MKFEDRLAIVEKIVHLDGDIATARAKLAEPMSLANRGKVKDLLGLLVLQRDELNAQLDSAAKK